MANFIQDLRDSLSASLIAPSTTGLTATGNSSSVDTLASGGINGPLVADINVGTVTGTTPSATFKWQESSDNVTFTDVVAPNAGPALNVTVTAAGKYQLFCAVSVLRYVRLNYAISGTTPVFPTSAVLFAENRIGGTGGGFSVSPQT